MKWTVAGAGALLCVAGFYALITGGSIIQVERGWATFIAGAVLLGAGVIVLGMAALMGRIDRLIAATAGPGLRRRDPPAAAADAAAMNRLQHALHDVPPPPREVSVEALPTLESLMPPTPAPELGSAHQLHPMREAASDPRPGGLHDFEFVFPTPEPGAQETVTDGRVEPIRPLATDKAAPRTGLGWLRRGKAVEPVTRDMPRAPQVRRSLEDSIVEAVQVHHSAADQSATAPPEQELVSGSRADDVAEAVRSDGVAEPVAVEAAAPEQQPAAVDPFSNDWLERALATDDAPRETNRFTPPSVRRAAALEQQQKDNELAARDEPSADDPAPVGQEAAAATELATPLAAGHPAPVEIGRYRANDVAYVMFSDGSITAETPTGESYRFMSLVELRAFIERGGT